MDIGLWVAQALLALIFMVYGGFKVFFYERVRERLTVAQAAPRWVVMTIGTLEMLGAIGVILPAATGILPWLTPVAAIGLTLTMLGAMAFNVRTGHVSHTPVNIVLLLISLFVVYGRFVIAPL